MISETSSRPAKTANQAWDKIDSLNLQTAKMKLAEAKHLQWTDAQIKLVEAWYKRFLFLMHKYPEQAHRPTVVIDEFWHQHILDTRKYARDCRDIFGYFLHHDPNVGPEYQHKNASAPLEKLNALFIKEFGEPLPIFIAGQSGNCSNPIQYPDPAPTPPGPDGPDSDPIED